MFSKIGTSGKFFLRTSWQNLSFSTKAIVLKLSDALCNPREKPPMPENRSRWLSFTVPVKDPPNARDFPFLYDTTSTLTIRWSLRLVKSQYVLGEMILEIVVFCRSRVRPFLVWNHLWSEHWCSQVLSYWVWLSHLGPTTRTVIWTFTVLFWFRPTDCTLFIHLLFPLSFCYITLKWVRFLT